MMPVKVKVKINTTPYCFGLFAIFLVLKLMGYITWSWWYVTMPLWLPITLSIVAVVLFAGMSLLVVAGRHYFRKFKVWHFKRLWRMHKEKEARKGKK